MSSHGDAAADLFSARAAASRANGAKSNGPRTAEGKARASRNALRHGMCAKKFLLLPDDSRAEFAALEGALLEELRPQGALQTLLARRLIAAAWRISRADRLEFEMLIEGDHQRSPGGALIRDGGAERAFGTLVRYRNGAQAEFFRTLRALEARAPAAAAGARSGAAIAGAAMPAPRPARGAIPEPLSRRTCPRPAGNDAEPHRFALTGDPSAPRNEPEPAPSGHRCAAVATRNEPERLASALRQFAPGSHGVRAGVASLPDECPAASNRASATGNRARPGAAVTAAGSGD